MTTALENHPIVERGARSRFRLAMMSVVTLLLVLLVAPLPQASATVTDSFSGTAGGGSNWILRDVTVGASPGPFRTITLTWTSAATNLDLGLRKSDGTPLKWSASPSGTSERIAMDVPAGAYTLAVSAKSGGATGYTLTVDDTQPPACVATFCGSVDAAKSSWVQHSFSATAGTATSVKVDWATTSADLNVGVKDPNGVWVGWTNGARPGVITFVPNVTGTYVVGIQARSGASAYTVTVTTGTVPPPADGSVGVYASAFGFGPKGIGNAGLYGYGVEWDATSNTVLVGDVRNHRILRYTPTGQRVAGFAITSAGTGVPIEPFDVEVGPDGKIYSTSEGLNRIDVWNADGSFYRSIGRNGSTGSNYGVGCGDGKVTWPSHLSVIGTTLYASDGGCSDIYAFHAQTGSFIKAFGLPAIAKVTFGVTKMVPRGLEEDEAGNLAFVDHASRRIAKFSPAGTLLPGWPTAPDATMMDPRGLSVDETNGDIYVVAALQNQVYRFDKNGTLVKRIMSPVGGFFNTVRYISATNGELYIGDTWGYRVWHLDRNGNQLSWSEPMQAPPNGGYNQLSGIAVDSSTGRLYGNDTYGNRIQGFATRTSTDTLSQCLSATNCPAFLSSFGYRAVNSPDKDGLNYPRALAAAGGFVFSDAGTSIVRYDSNGKFLNRWGTWGRGNSQYISGPTGLDVVTTSTTTGKVYAVDAGNCRIMVTDYVGTYIDQMGSCGTGTDQMRTPYQIDVVGNLAYVADSGRAQIVVWDLTTRHIVSTIRGTAAGLVIKEPRGVQVDPTLTWLYIGDTGNKRVIRVKISDPTVRELVTTGKGSPEGFLNFPRYLSFDTKGILYISDFNQRIYAYKMLS